MRLWGFCLVAIILPMSFERKRVLALLVSILIAVLAGFVFADVLWAKIFAQRLGYFVMAAATALWVASLVRLFLPRWQEWRPAKGWWLSGGVILGCSVFLLIHEPFQYKILMDEVVLLGTSQSMHLERIVNTPNVAATFNGFFETIASYLDKRPLFYPFVLSLLHDLTGYRPANAFVLNVLLTPVLLWLIYLAGKQLGDRLVGITGVLVMTTLPLLAQNATGAHFEMLNLVMMLVLWHVGVIFLRERTEESLVAFVFTGVLLAQTRYESALFVAVVGLILLWAWWRERKVILPWRLTVVPLLMLPIPWIMTVARNFEGFWQLEDTGASEVFSVVHWGSNIVGGMMYLFDTGYMQPNSVLLSGGGVVAMFLLLWRLRESWYAQRAAAAMAGSDQGGQKRSTLGDEPAWLLLLMLFPVFGAVAATWLYHWGSFEDPAATRLSLPLQLVMVMAMMATMRRFALPLMMGGLVLAGLSVAVFISWVEVSEVWDKGLVRIFLVLFFGVGIFLAIKAKIEPMRVLTGSVLSFLLVVATPTMANHYYLQRNWPAEEAARTVEFLKDKDPKQTFYSSHSAMVAVTMGFAGAGTRTVKANPEMIPLHLLHGNYSDMYLLKRGRLDLVTGEFESFPEWDDAGMFELELVERWTFARGYVSEMYRMTWVTPETEARLRLQEKWLIEDEPSEEVLALMEKYEVEGIPDWRAEDEAKSKAHDEEYRIRGVLE